MIRFVAGPPRSSLLLLAGVEIGVAPSLMKLGRQAPAAVFAQAFGEASFVFMLATRALPGTVPGEQILCVLIDPVPVPASPVGRPLKDLLGPLVVDNGDLLLLQPPLLWIEDGRG